MNKAERLEAAAKRRFEAAVAELRAAVEGSPQRPTLALLAITLLLTDLKTGERDAVMRRLAHLLRPRAKMDGGVSPPTHRALLQTAEAIH
jgi:hypothetical protein